jgi:hypothetical protein
MTVIGAVSSFRELGGMVLTNGVVGNWPTMLVLWFTERAERLRAASRRRRKSLRSSDKQRRAT